MEENIDEAPSMLGMGFGIGMMIFWLVLILIVIIGMWRLHEKAGKPGWAIFVPIYNLIVMLDIVRKPVWWIVLLLIPFVNLYAIVTIYIRLAKTFGKDTFYGIGMLFLGVVLIPMLAFSDAEYNPEAVSDDRG